MYGSKKPERAIDKAHITRRKAIRKAAKRRYPNDALAWVGGVLIFATDMWPVLDALKIPKPGKPVRGLSANKSRMPRAPRQHPIYIAPKQAGVRPRPFSFW
jgi:hypothetical protein